MKVYDSKVQQTCKICDCTFKNNKSGRFTSHLMNEHNLTLEQYLIKYFYSREQLKCQYEFCNHIVKLKRGVPNRFCSIGCSSKGEPLTCIICGEKFVPSNRKTKTCNKVCASKLRSSKTSAWHERMDNEFKEQHFSNIIKKTAKTRRMNRTPSWNSGRTGIYSPETIEKIRKATLIQLANGMFKKTSIERKIESLLVKMNLNYKYSYITSGVQFDFFLIDYGILIECDGDYWHANPKFYPNEKDLHEKQKLAKKKDLLKNTIAEQLNLKLIRFWEYDINHHIDQVEQQIINALSATT